MSRLPVRLTAALALVLVWTAAPSWGQKVGEAGAASRAAGASAAASASAGAASVRALPPMSMSLAAPSAAVPAFTPPLLAAPAAASPAEAVLAAAVPAPGAVAVAAAPAPAAAPAANRALAAGSAFSPLPPEDDAASPTKATADPGRGMFDGGKGTPELGNLFARANQATVAQRVAVQEIFKTVKSRPLFVDTNILRYATNGDPQWLFFFNKAAHVEISPQVSREYSYTDMIPDKAQAEALLRRERLFTKTLGPRLTAVAAPSEERRDALVQYLTDAKISLKDARMVAEVSLACNGGPCYLLTHDIRLANAVENLTKSPRLRQAFKDLVIRQRAADPGFPEVRIPTVIVAPKP